jgi:hypothetical protein
MTSTGGFNFEALAKKYAWPAGLAGARPYVRLNMAVNGGGESIDASGSSTGLSFTADRRLLKAIRLGADAVVVGARTVRAEGWNLPPQARLFVLTNSGNLPWETCPDRGMVRVLSQFGSMRDVVDALAMEGIHNVLVEGGVSIARLFAGESLFDDVCLTVSLAGSHSVTPMADSDVISAAFETLLEVGSRSFDCVSLEPAPQTHAVFTLWRRALNLPLLPAH